MTIPGEINPSISDLAAYRERYRGHGGKGGGPDDPMEARIAAVEKGIEKLDSKLDSLLKVVEAGRLENEKRLGSIDTKISSIDAKLDAKASSEMIGRISGEFGARVVGVERDLSNKATVAQIEGLKGAVDKLPTTWGIIGPMAGLIFATLAGVSALAVTIAKIIAPAAP